jgi:hypothetical protein
MPEFWTHQRKFSHEPVFAGTQNCHQGEQVRNFTEEQVKAYGVLDANGKRIIDPSRQLMTIEQGAATQVWCATSSLLNGLGGVYCENVEIARVVPPDERSGWASDDSSRKVGVMPSAIDQVSAERLWSVSVEMTGVSARP